MGVFHKSQFIIGFLFAILVCLFLEVLEVCSGENASASFVFGDSLVDAGNNNYIVTLSKANHVPNGIDLLPNRQPTGRYTNGRTIADILGQELGLKDYVPPYLAPTTVGAGMLHGVNYASGGGGILNNTGSVFIGRINLDAQIDDYANTRQHMISLVGSPAALKVLRTAIFSVTIGSNDFINNYLIPGSSILERATETPEMFVEAMISRYRMQLARLYYLDARKIIVANVGPIGCIPYVRDTNPSAGTNCVNLPNQLAQDFNKRLKDVVKELSSNLKEAIFLYADVYRIVSDVLENYKKYGFEVADSACCSVAGRFGGLVPCGPTSRVCPDRSKYVFWDAYHPTDAANVFIASRLLDGDSDEIFPMNVRQLFQS